MQLLIDLVVGQLPDRRPYNHNTEFQPTHVKWATVYFIEVVTFGINSNDLETAAPVLAAALGLPFRPQDSSFHGGDYYLAETAHGSVTLQTNCDADAVSEEPFEDDWPMDRLILYFSGHDDEAWNPYIRRLLALTEFQPTKLSKAFG